MASQYLAVREVTNSKLCIMRVAAGSSAYAETCFTSHPTDRLGKTNVQLNPIERVVDGAREGANKVTDKCAFNSLALPST